MRWGGQEYGDLYFENITLASKWRIDDERDFKRIEATCSRLHYTKVFKMGLVLRSS